MEGDDTRGRGRAGRLVRLSGVLLLLAAGARALAQPSDADRVFVAEAVAAGAAAVVMGTTAAARGSKAAVRDFGRTVVEEYRSSNEELLRLARALDLRVTVLPNVEDKTLHFKLKRMKGLEFDREYLRIQREEHAERAALFRRQAEEGDHPALKDYAAAALRAVERRRAYLGGLQWPLEPR